MCLFVGALLGKSALLSPTTEQLLTTESMNAYRPLFLCMKYVPCSLHLFKSYLANAKEADDKLFAIKDKSELYAFLEGHTVKDTLRQLLL